MILYISRICFYSVIYMALFVSLLYSKNVAYKYLRHLANNSIQIFSGTIIRGTPKTPNLSW
jgi:hypothetical protein